jgi:hypothetical protein
MADSAAAKKTASPPATRSRSQQQKGGEAQTKKLLIIIVLFACCVGSGYLYKNTVDILQRNDDALSSQSAEVNLPDPVIDAEKKEIDDTEAGVSTLTQVTNKVMLVALSAERMGTYPVALPTTLVPTASVVGPDMEIVVAEPEPPFMDILAIMITDQDKVAMVNIDGEQDGLMVRQGSKFANGTARVTKIDVKGLNFTWMKKNYRVSF